LLMNFFLAQDNYLHLYQSAVKNCNWFY
jgi:hypothetical protein